MSFFNHSEPLLCRKQSTVGIEELAGVWCVTWQIGKIQVCSTFYTRIDQACIFWSLLLMPIFITAQFLPVNWSLQAILWSISTCIGVTVMVNSTSQWVKTKHVSWVLYSWVVLMLSGVLLTDLSIFLGWGNIIIYLCPLWLGITTVGYLCTGVAVRSRAMMFTGIVHLLGILIWPYIRPWQFIATGGLMVFCLLTLAEFQWDGL